MRMDVSTIDQGNATGANLRNRFQPQLTNEGGKADNVDVES
jgi:hypothetical protein